MRKSKKKKQDSSSYCWNLRGNNGAGLAGNVGKNVVCSCS